jgi:hypothetical protein
MGMSVSDTEGTRSGLQGCISFLLTYINYSISGGCLGVHGAFA